MTRKKPCATCGHGKSYHARTWCKATWQAKGETFAGIRVITHSCPCTGFEEKREEVN